MKQAKSLVKSNPLADTIVITTERKGEIDESSAAQDLAVALNTEVSLWESRVISWAPSPKFGGFLNQATLNHDDDDDDDRGS